MRDDSTREEQSDDIASDDVQTDAALDVSSSAQRIETSASRAWSRRNALIVACVAAVAIVAILAIFLFRKKTPETSAEKPAVTTEAKTPNEVILPQEALSEAGLEIVGVTVRPAVALLTFTGTVQANQEQTQQVTPLVGGRVERVLVALGDRVRAGTVLATIASPQIAEMRGNLRAAETKLQLAERNYARVQRSENRAAVLQAKAKLDEADATLRRTRRLIELGVGAGKDLIAADAAYKSAKAEYDFQNNIALNREVQQAQADVETARSEVAQLRQGLLALGASASDAGSVAVIAIRAPTSGSITERFVNSGAGIEVGKPLFAIANLSSVWVIANVPEAQIGILHQGTLAEVRSVGLGKNALAGKVNYIDPQLSEETRTARVRVEVINAGERLKAGMFVEVGFQAGTNATSGEELVVPSEAVQRIGDRDVVFLPKDNQPAHFEVRDIELGGETGGYRRVLSGLKVGDRVVTKGSFILKSQLMKGQFGDDETEGPKK